MARLNLFYILTVVIIASGSIPKGYDEGGFAGVAGLTSFLADYHLLKHRDVGNGTSTSSSARRPLGETRANITSFGVLGAAIGAAIALGVTDRYGRLRTWQAFMALWMSGFLVTTLSAGHVSLLLFSRLWSGFGAGGLTVVAPLYLTEIAPSRSRGMIVSVYMVVTLSFLMFGFFINYGAEKSLPPTRKQYRMVLGVAQIPVGIALIFSFFLKDTPRWLASKGRDDEALEVLARLRKLPVDDQVLLKEHAQIVDQIRDEKQMLSGVSAWTIIKEVIATSSYRNRFLLGLAMQTVAQWSGGNGITYYIPQIFKLAGVQSENLSLINSGAYGAVKLFFTMIFTWGLIDVFGRRRCFIIGLFLQCITHIYMAVYMGIWIDSGNKAASDAAIASVFVYAVGWSIGLCTVQYLYGTEILPTRIRSVCYAFNMMVHWFFQFAVVRVTPAMFDKLDIWGAYAFWAIVCAVGLLVLGLWAPETKGVPIERMGELFSGPWSMGWKAKLNPQNDVEYLDRSISSSRDTEYVEVQRFGKSPEA